MRVSMVSPPARFCHASATTWRGNSASQPVAIPRTITLRGRAASSGL